MLSNLKLLFSKINLKLAYNLLFIIFGFVLIFHFLILFQIIDYKYTWGGNLKTLEEMYVFESVSILINVLIIYVVFRKRKLLISNQTSKIIKRVILAMAILFFINTLGNLTAKNILEFAIATPITLILSLLCFRMSIE